MALVYQKWLPNQTRIGVWSIIEPLSWFEERLVLSESEQSEVAILAERKRLEWFAGRWLLHVLLQQEDRAISLKDEFGKPYLLNSTLHISLSHSGNKAAVIISPKPVGIDIQYFTPKIERIERKFMRIEESNCLSAKYRLEHLHVFWGAKESLYKAYGKRELEFREHIIVAPFDYDLSKGITKGQVQKADFCESYAIQYTVIDNYSLTFCIEND
jgi:phosphopantetheinyl transferase